jgi:hypothetical protein
MYQENKFPVPLDLLHTDNKDEAGCTVFCIPVGAEGLLWDISQ